MLDRVVNVALLKSPMNWLTVILMTLIAALAVDSIVRSQRALSARLSEPPK